MYKKKFGFNKKIRTKFTFLPQQKNDTTAQLYCTLSTYITPKTIPRQNQKTNTTPLLYGTLSTQQYVQPKPISHQSKKLKQQHNWKKGSSSPREASVFISLSVIPSMRAKRWIQSKRVLIRKRKRFLYQFSFELT